MKEIKQTINHFFIAIVFMSTLLTFNSCSNDDVVIDLEEEVEGEIIDETDEETDETDETDVEDADFVATDWTDETHSKDGDPNFDEIFPDDEVKRIDIVITEERWGSMLADMTTNYGDFGGSNTGGGPGGQGGQGGGGLTELDENPIFVPAEVFYENKEWYRVGVRFKGNSSLQSSWQAGILKLSFKLDFDEYEDDYPQIKNQRFYGFKKLSLKNNYDDPSLMREKVAADVFKNAGLAMSHTSFCTVYVDHGDGPQYFGLYTLVEEVDDTVIDTQFSSDDGNLYKPDGDAASFANGTFDQDEYEKKTNEDEADFTDVQNLLTIINDGTRTTDAAAWRTSLDAVFDTDIFLKYLAVNTVIQNWDTYGRMTHNYFLYNNPDTSKLTWIAWDNNEALQTGKQGGSYALNFSGLSSSQWPIIGNMYADAVYKAKYDAYVQEVIDGAFNETTMHALYTTYAALIEPYATTEVSGYTFLSSGSAFQSGVTALKSHATSRKSAVSNYLD